MAFLRYFFPILCFIGLWGCSPSIEELGNTYRGAFVAKIKGFDPATVQDLYSHISQKQIYEPLYQYRYLHRPIDVEPLLADSLPHISADGLTYTIRMKRGIYYSDDAAFPAGQGREANIFDFIFAVKRLADVRAQSTGWWLVDGKIEGLNDFRQASESYAKGQPGLYQIPVSGLTPLDSFTVQLRLTQPYPYFKYILAMGYTSLYAQEVVDFYGDEFLNHPVGTGPFYLKEWWRGLRLVFEKNPKHKHSFYPLSGTAADSAEGLLADAGLPLPFLDRVEIHVFMESQPMWLNFLRGNLDVAGIPKDNYSDAISPDKSLSPLLQKKGIHLQRSRELDLVYTAFNMNDSWLGKNKKLRQAISLARNIDEMIELFYNGRAIRAHSPLPPGLFGYEESYQNPYARFDTSAALQLLQEAGFPRGQGLPEFEYLSTSGTTSRQMSEHFVRDMARIGVRFKITSVTWPEFLKRIKENKFQMCGMAWGADYPDPENFLQLLYGPNKSPGENNASYQNPLYDSLFQEISVILDSPERLAKIQAMKKIVAEDCPWIFGTHRIAEGLHYNWLKNKKPHEVENGLFKYYRIGVSERENQFKNNRKHD